MSKLYIHESHPHQPEPVTAHDAREEMRARGGLNTRIAVLLTKGVGSMWTAYLFALLAIIGLLGVLNLLAPIAYTLVAWTSQTFIQLTLLPIIMVGQAVLGKHQELVSEEMAKTTQKSYHQLGQMVKHLNAQDEELLKQTNELVSNTSLLKGVTIDLSRLEQKIEALDKRLATLQRKASA